MPRSSFLSLWLALLAAGLTCAAGRAITDAATRPEFAKGWDSYGYLSMSRALRTAWAEGHWPRYELESPQSEALARELSASALPVETWDHLVAPHAYHYLKTSRKTVPQYPPGTAIMTAPFPEGTAVFDLTVLDVLGVLAAGLAALALAWRKRAWVGAGWVTLVAIFAMRLPEAVGGRSYSVEALLLPCGLGAGFAALAWVLEVRGARRGPVLGTAAVAGALLGFSILCRLPCVFVIPGLVAPLLLLGRRGLLPAGVLCAGVFFFGFLPLFAHQAVLTGKFYLPTYAMSDVSPTPSLQSLRTGLSYYLGRGEGAGFNWSIATLAIALPAGLGLSAFNHRKTARLATGAFLAWGIPTAYFLSYQIQEPYYLAAGTLAGLVYLAAGLSLIERPGRAARERRRSTQRPRGSTVLALSCLASWPALSMLPAVFRGASLPRHLHPPAVQLLVPPELRDPKAWVWSDFYSGTLGYYGGHAALRLSFSTPESRQHALNVAREAGGEQFILDDGAGMPAILEELKKSGAELEPRGKVDPYPYFRMTWPSRRR